MAAIKIAQLNNQTTISDTDTVIVETATSTNKMSMLKLKELLGIQGGGIETSGVDYIKFKNGSMICWGSFDFKDIGIATATVQGLTIYRTLGKDISFPQVFYNDAYKISIINTGSFSTSRDSCHSVRILSKATSFFRAQVVGGLVSTLNDDTYDYTAIGRWKA